MEVVAAAAAFLAAWLVTAWMVRHAHRVGLLDEPNVRSSHTTPTPRGGGLGVCAGVAAGWAVAAYSHQAPHWALGVALLAVAAVGFWDDMARGVPAGVRFPLQALASLAIIAALGPIERFPLPAPLDLPLGWLSWPLTLFWMVSVLNIYNFLDGIDGFAGTQGLVAGLAMVFLPGPEPSRWLGAVIAAACAAFLHWNWHPARIFMGDVGSTMLGLLFASAPLAAEKRGAAVFSMTLLLWFFLADGTFTILRRVRRGEKIWEAHRSHLYQRLVIAGLRHSTVSARVGLMMAGVAALAVWAAHRNTPASAWLALGVALAGFWLYWHWVTRTETR